MATGSPRGARQTGHSKPTTRLLRTSSTSGSLPSAWMPLSTITSMNLQCPGPGIKSVELLEEHVKLHRDVSI